MRRWVSPLLVMVLVMAALPTSAQAPETPLLEDAQGDQVGSEAVMPPYDPAYAAADLVSLSAKETEETLVFQLQVADLSGGSQQCMDATIHMDFDHNGVLYRVEVDVFEGIVDDDGPSAFGGLFRYDPGLDEWNRAGGAFTELDPDTATIMSTVWRTSLRDADGLTPQPGRPLKDFIVSSEIACSFNISINGEHAPQPTWMDQMPDSGPAGELPIVLGLEQRGDGRLTADRPMRASNGEAATFLFEATAVNTGDAAQEYTLAAEQLPAAWDVRFPVPYFELDAGETLEFPVVASVPFAHQHGSEETFIVQMRTLGDAAALAQLEMGLYYLEVPQPSGHHPDLWFHTYDFGFEPNIAGVPIPFFGDFSWVVMNTLPDDERAVDEPAEATTRWSSIVTIDEAGDVQAQYTRYGWFIGLSNGLQMGLDFDLAGEVQTAFTLQNGIPLHDADLTVSLNYGYTEDDGFERFSIIESERTIELVGLDEEIPVDLSLPPTAQADLLPFRESQGLWLEVWLNGTLIGDQIAAENVLGGPVLLPGGTMHLPLNEYRDPVDDLFEQAPVEIDVPQEILINPGTTRVVTVEVRNGHAEAVDARLSVGGPRAGWVDLGSTRVRLDPGAVADVPLTITAPADLPDGDAADLVLEAYEASDPTARTLARILVEVDTDEVHEAVQISTSEAASAPGLLVLLAAALIAYRRRS